MLASKGAAKYVFEHSPFNLLTASVIKGWGLKNDNSFPGTAQAMRLIKKLELYLECFPNLQKNKSFRAKVGNLAGFNFLSTLSELSIAAYLKQAGATITFEQRFQKLSDSKRNDVDITVTDKDGVKVHLEVYAPSDQDVMDGFMDPVEGNYHYAYKVAMKLMNKFGNQGIGGLTGDVLLAINTAFLHPMQLQKLHSWQTISEVHHEILINLPPGVAGLLQFSDNFGSDNSIHIEGYYKKEIPIILPAP